MGPKFEVLAAPPATRTFPFGSSRAAASQRGSCIEPVKFHAAVEGSNNSALDKKLLFPKPPAARTFPLDNKVAVADWRGAFIAPPGCQLRLAGSKISELPTKLKWPSNPAATRTFPLASETPTCPAREEKSEPVESQFFAA